jgi:hypothetical protein
MRESVQAGRGIAPVGSRKMIAGDSFLREIGVGMGIFGLEQNFSDEFVKLVILGIDNVLIT